MTVYSLLFALFLQLQWRCSPIPRFYIKVCNKHPRCLWILELQLTRCCDAFKLVSSLHHGEKSQLERDVQGAITLPEMLLTCENTDRMLFFDLIQLQTFIKTLKTQCFYKQLVSGHLQPFISSASYTLSVWSNTERTQQPHWMVKLDHDEITMQSNPSHKGRKKIQIPSHSSIWSASPLSLRSIFFRSDL